MQPCVCADTRHVEAAEQSWRPLGELLVTKGLVTEDELQRALKQQEETGELLGTILVDRGFVSGPALAVALAEQYGVELSTERGFGTGLWAEIDRLQSEFTRLKVVEVPEQPSSHVVFVPTPERYLVFERQGPPPEPGDALDLPEGSFVVGKVGRAPFPGEPRVCAFLLRR